MTTVKKSPIKRLSKSEKFDKEIEAMNIKNHEALAFGLVDLIAKNCRIEREIVSNYLNRNKKFLIDRTPEENEFAERMKKEIEKKARKKKRGI